MATYLIIALRDIKQGAFAQPYCQKNEEVAKRSFYLAINDKRNENLYPIRDDLELWKLGEYDDTSGKVNTKGMPQIMFNRGELVKREEAENQ